VEEMVQEEEVQRELDDLKDFPAILEIARFSPHDRTKPDGKWRHLGEGLRRGK